MLWRESVWECVAPSFFKIGVRTSFVIFISSDKITTGKRKHEDDEPVFEQIENTANPSRCPVKMFECYLSKR